MSERSQVALVWWSLAFIMVFGNAWFWLIGTMPLPPATQGAEEVAAFYAADSFKIRLGAALASWTSAFTVPMAVVISVQIARLEKGISIWAILQFAGGILTSIFVVIPAILWGIAAFNPERPAEITLILHQSANLIFVTTTQYFIFQMVPIAVICLTRKGALNSPFAPWFGYLTIWMALLTEVAVAGYLTKTGPFAWDGLFVFYIPVFAGGAWLFALAALLLRAISRQRQEVLAS